MGGGLGAGAGCGDGPAFEMLDPAPVGVAVTRGPEHRLIYLNRMCRSQLGDPELGSPFPCAFTSLTRERFWRLCDQVFRTGESVVLTAVPLKTEAPPDQVPSQEQNASQSQDQGPSQDQCQNPTQDQDQDQGQDQGSTRDQERFFTCSLSRISFGPGDHGVLVMAMEVTEQISAARQVQAIADERRRILRRYQSLIQVSAQIIWVTGPGGDPIEPSPSWERVTGQPWEEFGGNGWLRMVHPDDQAEVLRTWQDALDSRAQSYDNVCRLRVADGGYRHFRVRAVPVYEHGRLVEWVGSCSDVERQWQERRSQDLLDRAAAAMGELSSLPDMLRALAEVIVPELADGCGIHLITDMSGADRGGPLLVERVAAAVRPGLPMMTPYGQEQVRPENTLVQAVRQRRPLLATFAPGNPPPDLAPSGAQRWVAENDVNGMLILPVVVDGAVPAVVTTLTCGNRPPLDQADIALLTQMFDHAHDALSNAIRFQRAQQIALALQHSLLAEPPLLPGLRIAARYRASPAAAEVGGDWYDSFVLPDGAPVIAIGDVAGHDLAAAVEMSQLRNMLRALAMDRREPPGEILTRLNKVMSALSGEVTATCVLARVEETEGDHRLHYAVAGHPPPLLVTYDGTARFLDDPTGSLLGIGDVFDCPSSTVPLPPGSTLLLYTDGLIERMGEHLDLGLERLRELAQTLAREPVDAFCDRLLSGLPTTGLDDIAVLALRRPGPD
ncbi:SpoIIE family protein phosphatase [Nonomuraea fuscirosea]|uniref:SpoIIE family protein phosphatase n=1 Tax=Nonomuraea fuscirosea TaxID=1291556 RepID=UPI002DDA299E|nr:SpoIIE family protein phosphatase [Nonomuraea fuscirosea]WSA57865.1 SpoIIE family protein phosphatase [Nonomuraea fuscirosea]